MKLTIGHLHRVIKNANTVCDLLDAPNTPQFIGELKTLAENPDEVRQLMGYIEALRNTVRALEGCVLVGSDD